MTFKQFIRERWWLIIAIFAFLIAGFGSGVYSISKFNDRVKSKTLTSPTAFPAEYRDLFLLPARDSITHFETMTNAITAPFTVAGFRNKYALMIHKINSSPDLLQNITFKKRAGFSPYGTHVGSGCYYIECYLNAEQTRPIKRMDIALKGDIVTEVNADSFRYFSFKLDDLYVSCDNSRKNDIYFQHVGLFPRHLPSEMIFIKKHQQLYMMLMYIRDENEHPDPHPLYDLVIK